jgi:antitoxin HigA-1
MAMSNKTFATDMQAANLTPAFPTHPGTVIKEEIEYRGISQCQLAKDMGIAYSALNDILNERRPLTEKTALLFEAALGINAEPLMKLQMGYNMQKARKDSSFMDKLSRVRRIAAAL